MIITMAVLAADWAILTLNDYPLLSYHSVYIGWLVLRLWARKQPEDYCIREKKETGGNGQEGEEVRICLVCRAVKPDRYYHCRRCNRCIYLMDHHCNWVGNCIGQFNSKVYLHLLANILIHSTLVLLLILYNYAHLFDIQQHRIYFLIDLVPALYSLYEGQRLLADFCLSVKNNQTLVQSYKNVHGERTETLKLWQKYLGESKISWSLPIFQSHQLCNLLERVVYPKDEEVKEYDDPEDYIYGPQQQQQQEQALRQE